VTGAVEREVRGWKIARRTFTMERLELLGA
jgi:hypothetical protein